MSFWQFFFTACWREVGMVARAVQITLVSIPLVLSAVIGLFGGEWSRNSWPWWVWLIISVAVALISMFVGITRQAYLLERSAQLGFRIEPGNAGRWMLRETLDQAATITRARFGIRNTSRMKSIDEVEVM